MLFSLAFKYRKQTASLMTGLLSFQLLIAERVGANPRPLPLKWPAPLAFGILPPAPVVAPPNPGPRILSADEPVAATTASPDKTDIGGPGQPESSSFQSVNANNMVDLFSGDFSYNIPLLDVGGYPVNIAYHSGISMDEEASWVGLGWNINPGSITRNMRGVPDDFNGGADTIRKVSHLKPNNSWGVTVGGNAEVQGLPIIEAGASLGVFHSTYTGWGLETALNASINGGDKSKGPLSGGLSFTNNSQNGFTIAPNLSLKYKVMDESNTGGAAFGMQLAAPYNTRSGLKEISLGMNASVLARNSEKNKSGSGNFFSGGQSFAWPSYTPSISMPMTNFNFSFTAKTGAALFGFHPNIYISGYYGSEYIAGADTSLLMPVFGYLNLQQMGSNWAALTDYNREKEIAYREKPEVPHIAVPGYTYDVFSVSGEGTGGSFRAYRGDIGFVADHYNRSKTITGGASVDLGGGNLAHAGGDMNANYSITQAGPWLSENPLAKTLAFRQQQGLFEAAYFRNPGEKTINSTAFYDAIGGDDVVAPALYQANASSPGIRTTNQLVRYKNKKEVGRVNLTNDNVVRNTRDKRAQVISYLTAGEAAIVGHTKQIERYEVNQFWLRDCIDNTPEDAVGKGTGLMAHYYTNKECSGTPVRTRQVDELYFNAGKSNSPLWYDNNWIDESFPRDNFSVRWTGRLRTPETGTYTLASRFDDGMRMWVNDSLVMDSWNKRPGWDSCKLNFVEGKLYDIKVDYYENAGNIRMSLAWRKPSDVNMKFEEHFRIPGEFLYLHDFNDTDRVNDVLTREDRVNNFRKSNHISEITVLNPDGRKYLYGIPVYNIRQKEVSFSVDGGKGNAEKGLVAYNKGKDNTTRNSEGKEGYFSKEEIPAYAHTFLLTGLFSNDYVDLTNDGITDDDLGDAVKFNYSKTSGIANPFQWRAPYIKDSANFNEGLKTYDRDDRAHYISGTKEMWYLHSIESKTMIATFTLQPRADMMEIDENGNKFTNNKALCLKKIDLYSKAAFLQHGTASRPIKTVNFEYSYELCRGINRPVNDSGKLTLKKVWFTYNGNDKGQQNPYVFHYHQNNPRYGTNASDKWGTYKSPAQNPGYTSTNRISNADYPYGLQDSSLAATNAGAWMLDSIKLPSGGRIKVKYESDDYGFVQNRRAAQLFKLAGFGTDTLGGNNNRLYNSSHDNLYIYVKVPISVSSKQELYARYLEDIGKLYFKLYVKMPSDMFGSGSEYVPCYADPDTDARNWYGQLDGQTIWIKVKGVSKDGTGAGSFSPLATTALNYLRLNLPSKAYPGSEVSDDMGWIDGVKVVLSMFSNIAVLLNGFNNSARMVGWASSVDTSRSFVRLNAPGLKKLGGGLRVKSIYIYDSWNAMTGKKESVYGQHYQYTTTRNINGKPTTISSGVAAWEPSIGGDENPFHLPIEYLNQASMLAPAAGMYSEEPLAESFFPGASVGYSKVRMRTVNATKTRSANGYTESTFYTSYDFPTFWDWSMLDNNSKKRYKPAISNFLRIDAKNYLTVSQGFKVELNDMNGKPRTQATYSETDPVHPISYTEYFYRVENQFATVKTLKNTVTTIDPQGRIDTAATIGKNVELMTDMRDQTSTSIGGNMNVNVDLFTAGVWPVIIPSLISLYQQSTNQFRSAAMTKVIYRFGILDSVVSIDKGSRISTANLLYDSETGEPLLTRTQNEFDDPVYQFTIPSHWAYEGIGPAYKNIGAQLKNVNISAGKITSTLPYPDSTYFTAGDELLVYSKQTISTVNCQNQFASFPEAYKLWVIDTNIVRGGAQKLFLVDRFGTPFTGNDVALKVIRSGRRNQAGAVGGLTSLKSPLVKDASGQYKLVLDSSIHVLEASASELAQYWKVADKKRSDLTTNCVVTPLDSIRAAQEACNCLRPFFQYLIQSNKLYTEKYAHITVGSLVQQAINAGYNINLSDCRLLSNNADKPFYALNLNRTSSTYMAYIGDAIVTMQSRSGLPLTFTELTSAACGATGEVIFKRPGVVISPPDTITIRIKPQASVSLLSNTPGCAPYQDTTAIVQQNMDRLLVENNLEVDGAPRNAAALLQFGSLQYLPANAHILSAQLLLKADQRGHLPPAYPNANSTHPIDTLSIALTGPSGWFPNQRLDTLYNQSFFSSWYRTVGLSTPFQDQAIDIKDYLTGYLEGVYASSSFMLTQGSRNLQGSWSTDSAGSNGQPGYLQEGYGNYYSTFYSQRYTDSTKWPVIEVTYVAPAIPVDTFGARLVYHGTAQCKLVDGKSCYSAITDTTVNPYLYGILGNFRPVKNYVYYGNRKETDPLQPTNIRTQGRIDDFESFWKLQQNRWKPTYDSSRWVWNSEVLLFNRKGFELENKDPLGRYNAGLYGYGQVMPVAVVQNSRVREAMYEGFEDYGFNINSCDTGCTEERSADFSAFQNQFTSAQAHTGLYSLRVNQGTTASITVNITAATAETPMLLASATTPDPCQGTALKGINASKNTLLPLFSPVAGKRILVSGWVKEDGNCACETYTRNFLILTFNGGATTSISMRPSGNIVEGWQRYEALIDVPANATQLTLTMTASDIATTYFDDIRIHPYHAQMKSYVYNSVNLRLMAELDENNYATYYEYDDDGTLVRMKKETERGILTIRETRSALTKPLNP
ncbi:MAG: PA14 domain-containing protein [Candidatus Pseudobacter hemicellulosilyticus]|uniref:PA14 domain-containing protein n=1 Tax=Candidatus Pseudobacter hemicellulosilyticus TaxID=3121375 RepID=A0AAJ6BFS0_9BACT|nr:MAG: PA14 domain-containing protein [Pseudobacter sp.]